MFISSWESTFKSLHRDIWFGENETEKWTICISLHNLTTYCLCSSLLLLVENCCSVKSTKIWSPEVNRQFKPSMSVMNTMPTVLLVAKLTSLHRNYSKYSMIWCWTIDEWKWRKGVDAKTKTHSSVVSIFIHHLYMRILSSRWGPRLLTIEVEQIRNLL